MNFNKIHAALFALVLGFCVLGDGFTSYAAELTPEVVSDLRAATTDTVSENEEADEEDKEELASAVLTEKPGAKKLTAKGSYVSVGESGTFDIDRSDTDSFDPEDLETLTRVTWFSSDTSVLSVDSSTGSYRGVSAGHVKVYVTGYADYKITSPTGAVSFSNDELFKVSIKISVLPDLSRVAFDTTEADIYINASGIAKGKSGAGCASFTLTGTDFIFDQSTDPGAVFVTADTKYFSYSVSNNVFTLFCSKTGDRTVTVRIGPKTMELKLHVKKLKQKGSVSKLVVKGKSTTLSLYQAEGEGFKKIDPALIKWKASNSRATVDSNGKVRAKKVGATCIRGTYKGYTYYWMVNVSTAKKAKVIAAGREIAKGTYSQPRRMQEAYYDCSSLVWRAYKPYGYNFGSDYYAPVAASEAKYLYDRGKMIPGAIGKTNTTKLKLKPGDLLFEGGATNGRWGGIYHVEMFAGYSISSIGSDGKPVYINTWVNRPDGTYGYGTANDYVGRP